MKMQFNVTFKQGQQVIATVLGIPKESGMFNVDDVTKKVIEVEQYLERLTGRRVHIESQYVENHLCPSCGRAYPYGDPRSVTYEPCFECMEKAEAKPTK